MKKVIIELTQAGNDGSSLAQAQKMNYSLNITAEKLNSNADFQRLKEIVTNAELLFGNELKSNQSAEPGSSQE